MCTFAAEVDKAFDSCLVPALTLQTSVLFMVGFVPWFSIFVLLVMISLFEMAPKWSVDMLSSVPKCKAALGLVGSV